MEAHPQNHPSPLHFKYPFQVFDSQRLNITFNGIYCCMVKSDTAYMLLLLLLLLLLLFYMSTQEEGGGDLN